MSTKAVEKKSAMSFDKAQIMQMSKIALILLAITAVVALMLSAVNEITAPRIAAQKEQAVKLAMSEVLPADEYIAAENLAEVVADPIVTDVYRAVKGGETVGYCVKVAPSGFGGAIEMVVGVDAQGSAAGKVHIVNMSETPGLGTKAKDASFLDQFAGRSADQLTVKANGAGEDEISAVTGATVSSKAVSSGVKSAVNAAKSVVASDANSQKGAENNAE